MNRLETSRAYCAHINTIQWNRRRVSSRSNAYAVGLDRSSRLSSGEYNLPSSAGQWLGALGDRSSCQDGDV